MNALDDLLARMWARVLVLPAGQSVRRDDDFLDCGGHSLAAMRLIGRIREDLGVALDADFLFDHPAFGELADAVAGRLDRVADRVPGTARVTSLVQRNRLLHDWRGDLRRRQQPICVAWLGEGKVDREVLAGALGDVLARHPVLASVFPPDPAGDRVVVAADPTWPVQDHGTVSPDDVGGILRAAWVRPFDFAAGPLLRAEVATCAGRGDLVVLVLEHMICDGVTMEILAAEISDAYARRSRRDERFPAAQAPDDTYFTFAERQRRAVDDGGFTDDIEFWRKHWAGRPLHPRLLLPEQRAEGHHLGEARHVDYPLPGIRAKLAATARTVHGTPFMAALTAMALAQRDYAPEGETGMLLPTDGRVDSDQHETVGFYAYPLSVFFDVDPGTGFERNLRGVRRTLMQTFAHRGLITQEVVRRARPEADPLGLAQPCLFFDMRDFEAMPQLRLADFHGRQIDTQAHETIRWYPGLNATVALDGADGLLRLQYTEGTYDFEDVDAYGHNAAAALEGIIDT
jgi:acyl carrier protein